MWICQVSVRVWASIRSDVFARRWKIAGKCYGEYRTHDTLFPFVTEPARQFSFPSNALGRPQQKRSRLRLKMNGGGGGGVDFFRRSWTLQSIKPRNYRICVPTLNDFREFFLPLSTIGTFIFNSDYNSLSIRVPIFSFSFSAIGLYSQKCRRMRQTEFCTF